MQLMKFKRSAQRRFAARSPRAHLQRGVGLIEVMIAVLVLSIGFLGVGALLAMSLSTNNSAMARSLATMDSYSIFDAMRADLVNARAHKYDTTVKGDSCPTTTATSTLAEVQLSDWCGQLALDLGRDATTQGTIACTPGTDVVDCKVTIQFDDSRAGVGGTKNQQVITQAIL